MVGFALAASASRGEVTGQASARTPGKLSYNVEWRSIRAGSVVVESGDQGARVKIDSAGVVAALHKVDSVYTVRYSQPFCAAESMLDSRGGKRHRQTAVVYDGEQGRATYTVRDLVKNEIRNSAQTEIPPCVHDLLGGIQALRGAALEPGQSTQLPLSNGRRSARVKVDAQEREQINTPAGLFRTVRYEVNLLNGVVFERKGRAFVWLTDDDRRLPVQIRARLAFPIGTVTLQLEKEESK
jgi:hypothetical protein